MKTAVTLGAIALAACGLAQAQAVSPGSEASGSSFSSFDKNNDGRISMSEARSRPELGSSFKALDKDGDGYLSPQELSGWSGTRGSSMKDHGNTNSTHSSSRGSRSSEHDRPLGPGSTRSQSADPGATSAAPPPDAGSDVGTSPSSTPGTGTGGATGGGLSTTPND